MLSDIANILAVDSKHISRNIGVKFDMHANSVEIVVDINAKVELLRDDSRIFNLQEN